MRDLIKRLLNEGLINEKKMTLNDLGDIVLLTKSTLDSDGGEFLFYNYKLEEPIGYISFGYVPNGDVFMVGGVYSQRGYGPLLYELAMTYVYPNGLTLSQDGGTSGDAQDVWEKFEMRDDVRKEPINRDGMTEKEEDLINGCGGDEDCLEDTKKVIQLHNTKFIFSLDKSYLNKLINVGIEYKNKFDISDDDIEYMFYDLE